MMSCSASAHTPGGNSLSAPQSRDRTEKTSSSSCRRVNLKLALPEVLPNDIPLRRTTKSCFEGYRVLESVGSGTYANVWKVVRETTEPQNAHNRTSAQKMVSSKETGQNLDSRQKLKSTEQVFAAKLLQPQKFPKDTLQRVLDMVFKEIVNLAACQCPGVVRLEEVVEGSEGWLIVQEYVEGGTVWCEQVCTDEDDAFLHFIQLVQAVLFLQEQKVMHRDLKPTNILRFKKNKRIVLADFGWSEHIDHCQITPMEWPGTLEINPPEVINSTGPLTERIDNYAVGMTLLLFLSGRFICRQKGLDAATAAPYVLRTVQQLRSSPPPAVFKGSTEAWLLFLGLTAPHPTRRWSLNRVLAHSWVQQKLMVLGSQAFLWHPRVCRLATDLRRVCENPLSYSCPGVLTCGGNDENGEAQNASALYPAQLQQGTGALDAETRLKKGMPKYSVKCLLCRSAECNGSSCLRGHKVERHHEVADHPTAAGKHSISVCSTADSFLPHERMAEHPDTKVAGASPRSCVMTPASQASRTFLRYRPSQRVLEQSHVPVSGTAGDQITGRVGAHAPSTHFQSGCSRDQDSSLGSLRLEEVLHHCPGSPADQTGLGTRLQPTQSGQLPRDTLHLVEQKRQLEQQLDHLQQQKRLLQQYQQQQILASHRKRVVMAGNRGEQTTTPRACDRQEWIDAHSWGRAVPVPTLDGPDGPKVFSVARSFANTTTVSPVFDPVRRDQSQWQQQPVRHPPQPASLPDHQRTAQCSFDPRSAATHSQQVACIPSEGVHPMRLSRPHGQTERFMAPQHDTLLRVRKTSAGSFEQQAKLHGPYECMRVCCNFAATAADVSRGSDRQDSGKGASPRTGCPRSPALPFEQEKIRRNSIDMEQSQTSTGRIDGRIPRLPLQRLHVNAFNPGVSACEDGAGLVRTMAQRCLPSRHSFESSLAEEVPILRSSESARSPSSSFCSEGSGLVTATSSSTSSSNCMTAQQRPAGASEVDESVRPCFGSRNTCGIPLLTGEKLLRLQRSQQQMTAAYATPRILCRVPQQEVRSILSPDEGQGALSRSVDEEAIPVLRRGDVTSRRAVLGLNQSSGRGTIYQVRRVCPQDASRNADRPKAATGTSVCEAGESGGERSDSECLEHQSRKADLFRTPFVSQMRTAGGSFTVHGGSNRNPFQGQALMRGHTTGHLSEASLAEEEPDSGNRFVPAAMAIGASPTGYSPPTQRLALGVEDGGDHGLTAATHCQWTAGSADNCRTEASWHTASSQLSEVISAKRPESLPRTAALAVSPDGHSRMTITGTLNFASERVNDEQAATASPSATASPDGGVTGYGETTTASVLRLVHRSPRFICAEAAEPHRQNWRGLTAEGAPSGGSVNEASTGWESEDSWIACLMRQRPPTSNRAEPVEMQREGSLAPKQTCSGQATRASVPRVANACYLPTQVGQGNENQVVGAGYMKREHDAEGRWPVRLNEEPSGRTQAIDDSPLSSAIDSDEAETVPFLQRFVSQLLVLGRDLRTAGPWHESDQCNSETQSTSGASRTTDTPLENPSGKNRRAEERSLAKGFELFSDQDMISAGLHPRSGDCLLSSGQRSTNSSALANAAGAQQLAALAAASSTRKPCAYESCLLGPPPSCAGATTTSTTTGPAVNTLAATSPGGGDDGLDCGWSFHGSDSDDEPTEFRTDPVVC